MSGYEMGQRVAAVLSGAGGPPFTENGVVLSGSEYLVAAAAPDCTHVIEFFSGIVDASDKQMISSYQAGNNAQGFRGDWSGAIPDIKPEHRCPIVGAADLSVDDPADYTAGDRLHILRSAVLSGGSVNFKVATWDETSGTWTNSLDLTSDATATAIGLTTSNVGGFSMFAATDGARPLVGTVFRSALWAQNGMGNFPDIFSAADQNRFTSGGSIIDPAVSHARYGQPLLEPLNTAAGMNAGTNNGSAADFTSNGTFT